MQDRLGQRATSLPGQILRQWPAAATGVVISMVAAGLGRWGQTRIVYAFTTGASLSLWRHRLAGKSTLDQFFRRYAARSSRGGNSAPGARPAASPGSRSLSDCDRLAARARFVPDGSQGL
jgi:hypothetical protein